MENIYKKLFGRFNYKLLTVVPLIVILVLTPFALNIPLGMDFTGGSELIVITEKQITSTDLAGEIGKCSNVIGSSQAKLDNKNSILIKTNDELTQDCVTNSLMSLGFSRDEARRYMPSVFKPELGSTLMESGQEAFFIAVVLMMMIVFIAFRTIIPSIAVILAALFDIIGALGLLSIFRIELNLSGVAALLMLIGYSVDTDIMLTSRLLRQSGKDISQRVEEAFTTGLTMTGTTLAAMLAIIMLSSYFQMGALTQIAFVLFFGLLIDLLTTWMMNVGILTWYVRRRGTTKFGRSIKASLFRS